MSSTIIGFFDDKIDAEGARAKLLDSGFKESDISLFSSGIDEMPAKSKKTSSSDNMSFGDRVKSFFGVLPDDWRDSEYANYYAEGIRRGGYTLSVICDNDAELDRVSDVLNQAGAVDIDKRAEFYKESGYTNFDINAAPFSRDESLDYRKQYTDWEKNRASNLDTDMNLNKNKDQVIPVVEEKVNIGKRAIEKGRVRIFTRVTETPVNQEVRLRDERVDVERRPVDRPVSAADMGAFKEGEMELRETSEEAVVNKEARVVEEVRVSQQAEEHTETVHETARRTDVEVDRTGKDEIKSKGRKKDNLINP